MDYDKFDKVPRVYDKVRTHTPEVQQQWLDLVEQNAPEDGVKNIVDLGSGTSRYSQLLADRFHASVTAVEPSDDMREQAVAKVSSGQITYEKGSGEKIPVPDASADLIFMSMVLHHLRDINATARECHRVLRQNGVLCVRNTTSDAGLIHQEFFPTVADAVRQKLPGRDDIARVFQESGLVLASHQVISQQMANSWQEYADKIALKADSFVASLAEEDFEGGMRRLREFAEQADSQQPVIQDIDFFAFRKP